MRAIAAVMISLALAACGGGGRDEPTAEPLQVTAHPTELVVIGNSLTVHAPMPEVGWNSSWGMNASAPAQDFAHRVANALGVPVSTYFAHANEDDPAAPLPDVHPTSTTVLVVELGDNGLPAHYADIVGLGRGAYRLVCTSTWWGFADRDASMRAACEQAGGHWVPIGDLYTGVPADQITDWVGAHPNDAQMAQIAARIIAAI